MWSGAQRLSTGCPQCPAGAALSTALPGPVAGAGATAGGSSTGARKATDVVQYPEAFKARMIQRLCGPDHRSATALAAEVGVPQSTLSRWLRQAGSVGGIRLVTTDGKEESVKKRPADWSPEERLRVVLGASTISDEELGAFLRREGLHEAQLREWREAALRALGDPGRSTCKAARRASADKRRVRELDRELNRKDKALAETAALLVLQKKARALWGDGDGDTTPRNGR